MRPSSNFAGRKKLIAAIQCAEPLEPRTMLATISGPDLATPDPTGVSSVLLRLAANGPASNTGLPANGPGSFMYDSAGRVAVDITAQDVNALAAPLAALGFV